MPPTNKTQSTAAQRRNDELATAKTNAKLRQRNIQIQAMHSMDRVTDEDDEVSNKENKLPQRGAAAAANTVHFDSDDEALKLNRDGHASEMFDTYLVVAFANTISHKALHWIVDKIRGKRSHGGAELLIRMEPQSE